MTEKTDAKTERKQTVYFPKLSIKNLHKKNHWRPLFQLLLNVVYQRIFMLYFLMAT